MIEESLANLSTSSFPETPMWPGHLDQKNIFARRDFLLEFLEHSRIYFQGEASRIMCFQHSMGYPNRDERKF